MTALVSLGDAGIGPAAALLRNRKADVREMAVRVLSAIGTPKAQKALQAHLADEGAAKLCALIREALPKAKRVPIAHFFDHGANVQPAPQIDLLLQQYAELYSKVKHTVVKPGDKIAVAGLDWRIVSAAGQVLKTPLPGAGAPNRYCANFTRHAVNPVSGQPVGNTEDEQSVGSQITFGKFRALYLGDFTWNQEFDLMCPTNRVGIVDLFVVSRHGQISSNSEALVHAIQPRVIIMNNGIRKGGQPDAIKVFLTSPRLENLWQIHFSQLSGQEYTVPGMFIANSTDEQYAALQVAPMPPPQGQQGPAVPLHNGPAYYFKVSAQQDGTFTVTNSRNGFSKTYRSVRGS